MLTYRSFSNKAYDARYFETRDEGHQVISERNAAGAGTEHPRPVFDARELSAFLLPELTYINYATNRYLFPEIAPERWSLMFRFAALMEVRYQAEKGRAA